MERRSFLNTLFIASAGLGLSQNASAEIFNKSKQPPFRRCDFSVDDNRISYFPEGLTTPLKIIQISDTHLWMDDMRGEQFIQYSKRMSKAYNVTKHFRTGEPLNPVKAFEEVLDMAVKRKADLIAMTGDIFSFPSEAAIEWVYEKLKNTGIPCLYISGNHDWHYEGMEGSSQSLREIWTKKRLNILYQGNDPMMASYKLNGITVLAIDNSTYEILPGQLEFLRKHVREGAPFILMMHIPMFAPGRSYGCGDPSWGAKTDTSFGLERRERWPENGPSQVTLDFHREVFSAPSLLGIFAGHIHRQTIDMVSGIPQFTADANATGAYLEIDFRTAKD